ncbi:MAG: class I SAM-dependent methyltransferase [Deltaproteobacteria bacterium]|nr:class I SAM-dependent methyltransferase [Deltaproteobacteria bacterium]
MERLDKHPYYFTPRIDIIEMVPEGVERILDIGCGGGETGRILKEKGKTVVGIEIRKDIAKFAAQYYDEVFVGDVEEIDLPFPPGYFDCIIYGDILEHLVDPWSLLKKHNKYLRMDGFLVVSIPNVRHYRVLKKLIFYGTWDYTDEGILDRTHLRFFTLKTAKDMISEAGFKVRVVKFRISGARWLKLLNECLGKILLEFLARQYLILAVKDKRF